MKFSNETSLPFLQILPFLNNPKDLDPSYKDGSRFLGLFWKEKGLSYNGRNMVNFMEEQHLFHNHPQIKKNKLFSASDKTSQFREVKSKFNLGK